MKFDSKTILSITHDKLLTSMDNIYKILNHMTGEELFTHQLPRAGKACKPVLVKAFPEFSKWDEHTDKVDQDTAEKYMKLAEEMFPGKYEVPKLNSEDYIPKNPISELEEMVGNKPIIVLKDEKAN